MAAAYTEGVVPPGSECETLKVAKPVIATSVLVNGFANETCPKLRSVGVPAGVATAPRARNPPGPTAPTLEKAGQARSSKPSSPPDAAGFTSAARARNWERRTITEGAVCATAEREPES